MLTVVLLIEKNKLTDLKINKLICFWLIDLLVLLLVNITKTDWLMKDYYVYMPRVWKGKVNVMNS